MTEGRPIGERDFILEADRLGADGFIIESEPIDKIYLSTVSWPRSANLGIDIGVIAVPIAIVMTVIALVNHEIPEPRKRIAYYRAFRYLKSWNLPAVGLGAEDLMPDDLRRFVEGASDFREEMARLNALFVSGRLDVRSYEHTRGRLCRTS
jgi:hypothetical protein